ncbi:MAG: alpha-mannosidase [Bacteroidales bacterium]|nr:alpha-mannosidase [Bacteroidales bacterium]
MKRICLLIITGFMIPVTMYSQPLEKRDKYDITKDKVLYTVGYAHLDTEWNWDYPATINEYIRNIMEENFYLFEKYPDYVFNFTGSRRYHMMKEYYPDLYKDVAEYIKRGRWYVSGSSVDEGEVNISSSESVIRQVLYGNNYFRREFGVESADYMLPDCFGFIASLPSVWNHCGLLGFSTQKLTWRSAAGIPFNVGIWNGPDGKGIVAALNATDYTGRVVPRLDLDTDWDNRISDDISKNGISFDFRYYGVGDQGGAPRENDVFYAINSLHNKDSKFKVILTSSDQIYKDITPEIRKKLPVYSGDLLLIEHSAGSLTSESYMKRANRKNELLAQSAEQAATAADWLGGATYPFNKLNNSWELVLGSQFHDILPGTSLPKAYEYAWNDEFIASNGFAEVLKNSLSLLSHILNTQSKGRAIVVYNSVARDREDVVSAELEYIKAPGSIKVFDQKGKEILSQIIDRKDNKIKILFLAKVPSVGLAVFDVRESTENLVSGSSLIVTDSSLENEYYKVIFATNGDIISIFDKKLRKELLSRPARLEFHEEKPEQWPAWNMDWKDRQKPPIDYMDKEASITIVEKGPVRIALQINRKGRNSGISQIVSLAAGEAGKHLDVTNKVDWQSKEVSLKTAFSFTADNEYASYSMDVGTIQRNNNNEKKFEVPAHQWFDLTDKSNTYGVTILEDCKYGSDKPDNNTMRLTLLYTPYSHSFSTGFYHQNSQDWGIHDIRYGIYSHGGDWKKGNSPWQAAFFNKPLIAFETSVHNGTFGKEISFLKINLPQVGLMAFKKMEQGEYYLIRINELSGQDIKGVEISLPGKIIDAYEVNGQEQKIGNADCTNGKLNFDISHYTIRSFAIKLQPPSTPLTKPLQTVIDLPFNQDAFSTDKNRSDADARMGRLSYSLPAELLPGELISEDIHFRIGPSEDRQNNVMACRGQKIDLPGGNYNKLYLLASASDDFQAIFNLDDKPIKLSIQAGTGYVGQFYNRIFAIDKETVTSITSPFTKRDNIAWFASHRHIAYPSKNDAYQYCYICKYEIDLPTGTKSITFPANQNIKIFAATVAESVNDDVKMLQPLYDDFKDNKPFSLR